MTITIKDLMSFFAEPCQAWIRAFSQLGASEQALLMAVLDCGGRVEESTLKEVYQEKASSTANALPFEQCLRRVSHSFLSVWPTWDGQRLVDFQHPSVRDILLRHLADHAEERKRYIRYASARSLAALIQALANDTDAENRPFNLVHGQDDLEELLDRLRLVTRGPLKVREWDGLLRAAELLIPSEERGEHLNAAYYWLGSRRIVLERDRVHPAELDLRAFTSTMRGQVIQAIARIFALRATFEANQRYGLSDWISLLPSFYLLSPYVIPVLYVEYLSDVLNMVVRSDASEQISAVSKLIRFEPLAVGQAISPHVIAEWDASLRSDVEDLKNQGDELEERAQDPFLDLDDQVDLYDDYSTWSDRVASLLPLLAQFYSWSGYDRPEASETVAEQSRGLSIESPWEEEDDDDRRNDESDNEDEEDYWTIETLFADLY